MQVTLKSKEAFSILLLVILLAQVFIVHADNQQDAINQRISELQQEASQTSDLNRLMEIANELTKLAGLIAPSQGLTVSIPGGRGKNPDEQINFEMDAINSSYERQKRTLIGFRDPNADLITLLSARKLHGTSLINGSNQRQQFETPYIGGVFRTLTYNIREDFVGYLLTHEYYDPKTGEMTSKRDYSIKTISSLIPPPGFGGKECIEIVGNNRKVCKKRSNTVYLRLTDLIFTNLFMSGPLVVRQIMTAL